MKQLLIYTSKGIYCEIGDFYIDPHKVVNKVLITHAHSDHAIRGHKSYLTHRFSVPILKKRLNENINIQGIEYGEIININGVKITFIPSGHIIGASQIRLEYKGEVWVVTGDYKIEDDGMSGKFEPIKCDVLITESTFGMPVFKWKDQNDVFKEINAWWNLNKSQNNPSILYCYSLGKAQRLINGLNKNGEIYVADEIMRMNEAIYESGIALPKVKLLSENLSNKDINNSLILTSQPSAKKFVHLLNNPQFADVSGWMAIRPNSRGFVLSDHADWNGLNLAVRESGAQRVYVTHGYESEFVNWLRKKKVDANILGSLS